MDKLQLQQEIDKTKDELVELLENWLMPLPKSEWCIRTRLYNELASLKQQLSQLEVPNDENTICPILKGGKCEHDEWFCGIYCKGEKLQKDIDKDKTPMEMIREAFEPIQLGKNMVTDINKESEIIKQMTGEPIEDVPTITSTTYPVDKAGEEKCIDCPDYIKTDSG